MIMIKMGIKVNNNKNLLQIQTLRQQNSYAPIQAFVTYVLFGTKQNYGFKLWMYSANLLHNILLFIAGSNGEQHNIPFV